jgi:hypothetical protein
MRIYIDITFGLDLEIESRVFAKLRNHVIEKRNSSINIDDPGSIEFKVDKDFGLFGCAFNAGLAWIRHSQSIPYLVLVGRIDL